VTEPLRCALLDGRRALATPQTVPVHDKALVVLLVAWHRWCPHCATPQTLPGHAEAPAAPLSVRQGWWSPRATPWCPRLPHVDSARCHIKPHLCHQAAVCGVSLCCCMLSPILVDPCRRGSCGLPFLPDTEPHHCPSLSSRCRIWTPAMS
jgi:hypothetical protein